VASAVPNVPILVSPPVSQLNDKWPQLLLGTRTEVKTISPAENITQRLPPIVIIEGAADTVTPPLAAQHFCDRVKELGGPCELNLYPKLGHILSRNLDPRAQEEGPFDPDRDAVLDYHAKVEAFLKMGGFLR
jgi:acetyl esterase